MTYFDRPQLPLVRRILIPRPPNSKTQTPIPAMLFFARPETELGQATELIFDCAGGGFVAMGPECHEERLRRWAKRTGKVVISVDYGKAPEYPYPYSIEQCKFWLHFHPFVVLAMGDSGGSSCILLLASARLRRLSDDRGD
jgi:acetyl esterase/lipase